MHRFHSHRNSHGKTVWVLLIAIVIVVAVSLVLWKNKQHDASVPESVAVSEQNKADEASDANRVAMPDKNHERKPVPSEPISGETKAKMDMIKAKQAEAAKASIDAQPISGTVSERPDFVSEIEWDVLKGAVAQNDDVDMALSHFVNKLLFFKKREAWMDESTDPEIRHKLARDLLAMIPQQLSENAIDQTFADNLSADLNSYLNSANQ